MGLITEASSDAKALAHGVSEGEENVEPVTISGLAFDLPRNR